MNHFFPSALYLSYAILLARLAVAAATRHKNRNISAYMLAECAVVALCIAAYVLAPSLYLNAYIWSGYLDQVSTVAFAAALQLAVFRRARKPWRSAAVLASVLLLAGVTTFAIVPHYISRDSTNPLTIHRSIAHDVWSFMAVLFVVTALYMVIADALPDRRLGFTLIGHGLNISFHAGLITVLLEHWATNPQQFKTRIDLLYFLSLVLWALSALDFKRIRTPQL